MLCGDARGGHICIVELMGLVDLNRARVALWVKHELECEVASCHMLMLHLLLYHMLLANITSLQSVSQFV